MTRADFEEMSEEWRKQFGDTEKRLDERQRETEKRVVDRHNEMLRTLGNLKGGLTGEIRTASDVLAGTKELISRPVPLPRGTTYQIPIGAKDIIGVSRTYPEQTTIVAGGPRVPLGTQSLIPTSPTSSGAVSFLRETSFTNNAAPVSEGSAKPKSEKVFTAATQPIEVIAHYFKISKQSWEDLPQVAVQIESNGIYGLAVKVDQQILKGTGTPPELGPGLYTIATAAGALPATGTTLIDQLFHASAELAAMGWQPNGAVLNAADYASMQVLKDTSGRYILSSAPGLPRIVTSPALAAGEFLVGDFNQARIFLREDANVSVATQNEDDYITNKLTCLAEIRLALVVYQTSAFRKQGTLTP
jgi:hypothetical protein